MEQRFLPFDAAPGDDGAFTPVEVVPGRPVLTGRLPPSLVPSELEFERLWALHPSAYVAIRMHGREVPIPRWHQAYESDYVYAGVRQRSLPAPAEIRVFLEWARDAFDARLNGITVNWYDSALGHYIGAHRDSRESLILGAQIVNVSLGEERIFRLRSWRGKARIDLPAPHGSVFVIPYATNLVVTHEVPRFAAHRGRRIAVTMRAFRADPRPPNAASR
jgi:alkylated DNA repair dioxygenase AlkB